jgi:hypothetical protein
LNFCFQKTPIASHLASNLKISPQKAQGEKKIRNREFLLCSCASRRVFFLAKKKPKEAEIFRNDKKANKAIAEEEKEAKNVSR